MKVRTSIYNVVDDLFSPHQVYTEEIFGPVLICLTVDTIDDAIALINNNPYGNGTAIFTTSGAHARKYQYNIDVGQVSFPTELRGAAVERHGADVENRWESTCPFPCPFPSSASLDQEILSLVRPISTERWRRVSEWLLTRCRWAWTSSRRRRRSRATGERVESLWVFRLRCLSWDNNKSKRLCHTRTCLLHLSLHLTCLLHLLHLTCLFHPLHLTCLLFSCIYYHVIISLH